MTIADVETAGQIAFSNSAETVDENFGSPPLVVTRTGGSLGQVTVDYRVTGDTATPFVSGDSTNTDFLDAFGTITFESGQTTATIPLTTYEHNPPVYEGPKTIEVTLGNPTGGATLGSLNTTVVTINDDDNLTGGFAVVQSSAAVEATGPVEIEVLRTGNLGFSQSVSYATSDVTAQAGVNYIAVSGTVTFAPGDVEKFIEIPILSDLREGAPGSFDVLLSDPTGSAILDPGHDEVNVAIIGNDSPGHFVVDAGQYNENSGTATITVERLDGARGTVTVDYATSDGTATAGSDYTAESGTLTFNNGDLSKSFTVPIVADDLVEGNETFFVILSNPTGGSFIDNATPVAETIDEIPGQFQFSTANYQVAEADASLTVAITFDDFQSDASGRPEGSVTVNYSTEDGTAQAGADYTAISGTLTFAPGPAGQYQQTITIPILNDSLVENNGTFFLVLSNPTGGPTTGGTATVTILDNDSSVQADTTPPTITGAPDRRRRCRRLVQRAGDGHVHGHGRTVRRGQRDGTGHALRRGSEPVGHRHGRRRCRQQRQHDGLGHQHRPDQPRDDGNRGRDRLLGHGRSHGHLDRRR